MSPSMTGSVPGFLSTPSGWRATVLPAATANADQFLSTPSGWRATGVASCDSQRGPISIHALRVEGDNF